MSKLLKAYDRSRVPLYIQVASVLRTRIQSGQWGAGEKISTLEELEREFEVARVTVRQAVDILREEGMLQARQGLGTFVSKRSHDRHWVQLATNWNSLIESLKDNVPRRLTIDRDVAQPDLAEGDGKAAASYVKLRSVQYRNDEPYSVVNLHLARDVFDMNPERFKGAAALVTIVSAPTWSKMSDADKKVFDEVLWEASTRASAEILDAENKLIPQFEKRGKHMWERLSALPKITCVRPQGAFYCFPNVSAYFGRKAGAVARRIPSQRRRCSTTPASWRRRWDRTT